jgi:putative nucleotidyltransferase with HDIG domain
MFDLVKDPNIKALFGVIGNIQTTKFPDRQIYVVGGFVRDMYLGRPNKDIDFAITGNALEFAQYLCEKLGGKNLEIFEKFGTVHFIWSDYELEFVTTRKESYTRESRKPIVETGTLDDDLSRRDLTINALAINITTGVLIDRYGSMDDLFSGILKTPVDPMETFNDDPLRIFRLARFAAQLDDFKVDDATLKAAEEVVKRGRLSILSMERITVEFIKLMKSNTPVQGLRVLLKTGALKYYLPELEACSGQEQREDYHHKDVFGHTLDVLEKIVPKTDDVWVRIGALLHDVGKPLTKKFKPGIGWVFHGHEEAGAKILPAIFHRNKWPLRELKKVEALVKYHGRIHALEGPNVTDAAIRRFIVLCGEFLDDVLTLCSCDYSSKNLKLLKQLEENITRTFIRIDQLRQNLALNEVMKFTCPVDGVEIMTHFKLSPGKKVALIKAAIEEAIINGAVENAFLPAFNWMINQDFSEILNN